MMKKIFWVIMAVALLSALVLTACGGGAKEAAVDAPPPAEYAGKTIPSTADAAAGQVVYTQNCVACHGEGGKGDGPAGAALDPKPADLTKAISTSKDDFLFWVLNEGGAPASLSASMASYKGVLSEADIWNVIAYIKTLK